MPAYHFGPWQEAVLHHSAAEDRPHFHFSTGKTSSIQEPSAFRGETVQQGRERLKKSGGDMCLDKEGGVLVVKWHHCFTLGRVPASLLDDRDTLKWDTNLQSGAAEMFEKVGAYTDNAAHLIRTQNEGVFFVQVLKGFEEADGRKGIQFRYKVGEPLISTAAPVAKPQIEKTNTIPFKGEPKLRYVAWIPKNESGWQLRTPDGKEATVPGDIPAEDWASFKASLLVNTASKISGTSGWLMFFYSHPALDERSESRIQFVTPSGEEIKVTRRICAVREPRLPNTDGWLATGCRVPYAAVEGSVKANHKLTAGAWWTSELVEPDQINYTGSFGRVLTNSGEDENQRAFVSVITQDDDEVLSGQWEVLGRLHDGSDVRSRGGVAENFQNIDLNTITFHQPLSSLAGFVMRSRELRTFINDGVIVPPPLVEVVDSNSRSTLQMRWVRDTPSGETEPLTLIGRGQKETLNIETAVLLDHSALQSVEVSHRPKPEDSRIRLQFTEDGNQRFAQATRDGKGRRLAIVIDGQVLSAPMINTEIADGRAEISGNMTYDELDDLAARLRHAIKEGVAIETDSKSKVESSDELPETVREIQEMLNETFRSKDYERTVRLCTKAIEGHSGVASYFSLRANAHNALGNFEKALADYTEALRLEPWDDTFHRARSMTYYQMGDFEKALADLNIAVEVSPQGVNFCVRGRVHHAKGDYQAALADYERALLKTPGMPHTFMEIAWLLATCPDDTIRNGEKADGYARLAEGVLSDSDRKADLAVMQAAVYAEQKNYALAIWQEGAYLKSVPPESKEALESKERLKVYQEHKPFRSLLPMNLNPWRNLATPDNSTKAVPKSRLPAPQVDIILLEATADEIAKALPVSPDRAAFKLDETSPAAIKHGLALLTAVLSQDDTKILLEALKDKARLNPALPAGLLSTMAIRDPVDSHIHLVYTFKGTPTEVPVWEHQAVMITVPDSTNPAQVRFYLLRLTKNQPDTPSEVMQRQEASTIADKASAFPQDTHISKNNRSVLVVHGDVDLHYVFYFPGHLVEQREQDAPLPTALDPDALAKFIEEGSSPTR
jgi:tetratricopeptide (TPR) repeat protein